MPSPLHVLPMSARSRYLVLATLAAALAGCDKGADQTAGQKVDSAVAGVERRADEATAAVKDEAAQAAAKTEAAIDKMADKMGAAADTAGSKVEDAAITVAVNAELAKDPKLSALRIDVDTQAGRVVLKGTAPDTASRERATQITAAVRGVKGVENQLVVQG